MLIAMRPQQRINTSQRTNQELRVRMLTSIGLRIGTVAGFAAAIMLIMSDVKQWSGSFLAYKWDLSTETAKPGDWVTATLEIPEASELGEFSLTLDLPEEAGFEFVSGSLEVYQGSLDGAQIPGYSGESSMGIYEIPAQDGPLHLEVTVQVPSDLSLLGKSVEFRPRFSVVGQNFKSTAAVLTIDAPDLTVNNHSVSAQNGTLGYEVLVSNPVDGIPFDEIGADFQLEVSVSHPDAAIQEELVSVITDQALYQVETTDKLLNLNGLVLAAGQQLSVFVPVDIPEGLSATQIKTVAKVRAGDQVISSTEAVNGRVSRIGYQDFTHQNREGRAFLTWKVDKETNNKGFFVEHSLDGIQFEVLALVPGSDDHRELLTYQYESEILSRGRHIFRLRQEDLDGNVMYTPRQEIFVGFERPATVDLSHVQPEKGGYLSIAVQKTQQVRVEIEDADGANRRTLFHGRMKPMLPYEMYLGNQTMTPGEYLVRFTGALEQMSLPVEIAGA